MLKLSKVERYHDLFFNVGLWPSENLNGMECVML
jgi:hypothetical protein